VKEVDGFFFLIKESGFFWDRRENGLRNRKGETVFQKNVNQEEEDLKQSI
jgi:hypothetical protein